ncbi:MAG: hypothetical protein JSW59_06695, partial [Phycisphaerales bacterium]
MVKTLDSLIYRFEQAERHTSPLYWCSMTVPHGETFSDDVAAYLPWLGENLFRNKYQFMEALSDEGEG